MSADITSNRELWWKFDDGTGTSALDSSGNGRTGTLIATPLWVPGRVTSGLQFTGANYVDSSYATNLSAFSVSAWFKTSAAAQSGFGGIIVGKLASNGMQSGQGWFLKMGGPSNNPDQLEATIQEAGGTAFAQNTVSGLVDGKWHHAVMTVNLATGTCQLYVDFDPALYRIASDAAVNDISGAENVRVGNDVNSEFFIGSVDEVLIYSRILAEEDIYALYQYGLYSGKPHNNIRNITVGNGMSRNDQLS
jgi:hypothetical protein